MNNNLKMRLKSRETLIGTLVTIPSTEVAEILSLAGFDYLWIELEHSAMDFDDAQRLIQAVGGRCPCVIRVPENKEVWIKKALDTGCNGIVIPQVKTAEEARKAVEWCLYPPEGKRSVGVSRAHEYGMKFQDYVSRINKELVIILQAEHIESVQNIASITAVPGIDVVFIGPFDLSGSMNLLGQITHPHVQNAIKTIKQQCSISNIPAGIFTIDTDSAKKAIADGFSFIALNMDAAFLWNYSQSILKDIRNSAQK